MGDICQEEQDNIERQDPNKSEANVDFMSEKPKKRRMSGSMVQSSENMIKDNDLETQMKKKTLRKDTDDELNMTKFWS